MSWERGTDPRGTAWPTLPAGGSRPQDSRRCSWSGLQHAQGSPQPTGERGEGENLGRGLAHASFLLLSKKELRANTVQTALTYSH